MVFSKAVLANTEYADAHQNILTSQLLLHASTEAISVDGNSESLPEELYEIAVEEKRKFVEAYRLDMDPESTIYGCASCGVYVTLPNAQPPYSRTLVSLGLLKLSEEKLAA